MKCVNSVKVPEAGCWIASVLLKAGFKAEEYVKFNTSQSVRTLQVGGTDEPGLYKGDFFSFPV